jgi:hypothetical protein
MRSIFENAFSLGQQNIRGYPKSLPHPRPFSRREKGENPLSLRERVRVRESLF